MVRRASCEPSLPLGFRCVSPVIVVTDEPALSIVDSRWTSAEVPKDARGMGPNHRREEGGLYPVELEIELQDLKMR